MSAARWMIYGANGYTGRLIAEEARAGGLEPVLAGRSSVEVPSLARALGLPARVFGLDDPATARAELEGHRLVLHCAGPFSATAEPMMRACLASGAHYLDITGEIAVFEAGHALAADARRQGIVICPGVGFDVIPTDCLASRLQQALPDATHLALGFDSRSGFSPGTAKTSVEGLALGGRVRREGKIVRVPLAWKIRRIDFGAGVRLAATIPWGDVATAYFTTGIPNVEVYVPMSPRLVRRLRMMNRIRWLLGRRFVQAILKRRIGRTVRGPSAEARQRHTTHVWGEVRNAAGQVRAARIEVANGYALTVTGALAMVRLLMRETVRGGYFTPSRLAGDDLVEGLPGSGRLVVAAGTESELP